VSAITVYHGTSSTFRGVIEDVGLVPPPGHSKGVRVALLKPTALNHAKAWAAYLMATRAVPPKGLIATARVEQNAITVDGDRVLVNPGIGKDQFAPVEVVEFPELYDAETAREAIELFHRMTNRKFTRPTQRAGARRN
jgi:hypothetical protein